MIDTGRIRRDFPILNQPGKQIVYFDNSCMSLRPTAVIEAITSYYTTMSACAGRSNHRLARAVTEAVDQSRKTVARFVGASRSDEIVFTRNTSEGMNLIAHSLPLKSGDAVVISDKEHNSNLVPWLRLKEEKGIDLRVVRSTTTNEADLDAWRQAIDDKVKLVSLVFTSNLDGVTNPVRQIADLAHRVGAKVMVDAAQAVPHQTINVQELQVDFLAFSAHKMCGPSGMGVLYGEIALLEQLKPFMVGGDTVTGTTYTSYEMLPVPEKFEAGLQDYAGIIGTGAAVEYISAVGLAAIHDHEVALNQRLTAGLAQYERIRLVGPPEPAKRGGVAAFTVEGADHHQTALLLDQVGQVMVRSGQHCVHSWFADRKLAGTVRASFYFYNTNDEVDHFLETLGTILKVV